MAKNMFACAIRAAEFAGRMVGGDIALIHGPGYGAEEVVGAWQTGGARFAELGDGDLVEMEDGEGVYIWKEARDIQELTNDNAHAAFVALEAEGLRLL